MKTDYLLSALDLVKPAILDQDLIPVLRHVCFRDGEVVAFNDIIAIAVPLEFEAGDCCVPGTILHSFLSTVNGDAELKISKEEDVMNIKAGRSKVELPTLDVREFFFDFPEFKEGIEFTVDESFLDAVRYVTPAVGDASMSSMELGVVMSVRQGCSEVVLYATDNLMISSAEVDVGSQAKKNTACILPKDFCLKLLAMCQILGEVPDINVSDEHALAHFPDNDVLLYSKTIEPLRRGRLSDDIEEVDSMIDDILKTSQEDSLRFKNEGDINGSLRRASMFVRGDIDGMVVFAGEEGDNFVSVEAGSDKAGNIEDKVDLCSSLTSSFCVTVKLEQMLEAVDKTGEDTVNPTTQGAMTFTYESAEISYLTLVAYKEDNAENEE